MPQHRAAVIGDARSQLYGREYVALSGYTQKMNTKKIFEKKLSRFLLLALALVMTLTLQDSVSI